jgi:chaperone modulatory protein CbpM
MIGEAEVVWLDERRAISLAELVEVSGLSERELLELVHSGAIPARETAGTGYVFSAQIVTVARTACRLRDDLELDTHGLGVALKLLERVQDLEAEIARLRAQLPRS